MSKRRELFWCLLIFVLLVLPFISSLSPEFVRDDEQLLQGNSLLQSWRGIGEWMLRPFWAVPGAMVDVTRRSPYYRPMCSLVYGCVAQIFGLGSALPFRSLDIVLHAFNGCLLFVFARRLVARFSPGAGDVSVPFFMTLFWGWHPQRIETVANATGMTDTLLTFWLLLSVFLLWRASRTRAHELLAVVCALAAFLSKESGLLAVPLLLFVNAATSDDSASWATRLRTSSRSAFGRGLLLAILTTLLLRFNAHVPAVHAAPARVGAQLFAASLWRYAVTAVAPLPWSTFRDPVYATAQGSNISQAFVVSGSVLLAVVVAMGVVAFRWSKKNLDTNPEHAQRVFLTLLFSAYAFLMLLPVLHVTVQSTTQLIADRFTYLPHALLLIGWCIPSTLLWQNTSRLLHTTLAVVVASLAVMTFCVTAVESQKMSSNDAMLRHELEVNPENEIAIQGLLSPAILRHDRDYALQLAELGSRVPAHSRIHAAVFQIYGVTAAIERFSNPDAVPEREFVELAQAVRFFASLERGERAEFRTTGRGADGQAHIFQFVRLGCDARCHAELHREPLFWEMWAFAHQNIGQHLEALQVLQRAEPYRASFQDPELYDRSYRLLALAHARLGQVDEAGRAVQHMRNPSARTQAEYELHNLY